MLAIAGTALAKPIFATDLFAAVVDIGADSRWVVSVASSRCRIGEL